MIVIQALNIHRQIGCQIRADTLPYRRPNVLAEDISIVRIGCESHNEYGLSIMASTIEEIEFLMSFFVRSEMSCALKK